MKPLIAIVNSNSFGRHFPEHLERLSRFADVRHVAHPPNLSAAEWISVLKDAHGIIASVTPRYDRHLLSGLPNLALLVRHGLGYDNIDVEYATERGIVVSRVPGPVEREALAEYTLGLMLALARHMNPAQAAASRGAWSERGRFIGLELRSAAVGLVGIGNIGSRVAEILISGFGTKVLAFDPNLSDDEIRARHAIPSSLDDILATCEIISLHCSLNDDNHGMLGEAELSRCRAGALIVNTARGELVNQRALVRGLESGHIGGYAADVVQERIMRADHPLQRFPNVLLLPHIGAYTRESLRGMGESVLDNLESVFLRAEIPSGALNSDAVGRVKSWG